MIARTLCWCAALLLLGKVPATQNDSSIRRVQSRASHNVVLRLPDPLNPGSTVYIPGDESSLGELDYEAERDLITQYQSVRDDIIHWFLAEPDKTGCKMYHAMRICRLPRDGSYTSIGAQAPYICNQDELMLYAQEHVRPEDASIETLEDDDWTRVYATFVTRLGMATLAADVRATLPSPVGPPSPSPPPTTPPAAPDTSSLTSHAQPVLQEPTGLFEVSAGTLVVLVGGACVCGAASYACVSRCRRTRGRRYQKLELEDSDQHDGDVLTEQRLSGRNAAAASATDILRAYAKSKQSREPT
jgi:hypothetical protein